MAYGDAVRVLGTIAVVIGHVADMPMASAAAGLAELVGAEYRQLAWRAGRCRFTSCSRGRCCWTRPATSRLVFYRKRLARLGVPLVFWSAFFMWFSVYYTGWVAHLAELR